jgi:drug/metabolite transporter (DMT)-like permease
VVGHYENFFITSAGASAAILGLLVVAVSVVNADDGDPKTRENRTVLAGSAFVGLVDIFFVSIVALTGGSVVFAVSSLAMAIVGLLATRQLVPRAKRAGNFSRGFRTRRLNIAFASVSAGATRCNSASP